MMQDTLHALKFVHSWLGIAQSSIMLMPNPKAASAALNALSVAPFAGQINKVIRRETFDIIPAIPFPTITIPIYFGVN